MSLSRTPCQPQRLDAFWKEELTADQVGLLEEHLNSCELCQSRFEEYLQQQSLIPVLIESRAELQARSSELPTTKDPSESRVSLDDGLSVNLLPSGSRQPDQLQGMREFAARWFPLNPEHPHSADQVPANGNTPSTKGILRSQAVRSQANCGGGLAGQETGGLAGQVALGAIEHFDLLDPIGSGGMGFVYRAYDRRLHRLVALKVLTPTMAATGAARQRFLREAQAAATIVSPHVVPIHAIGQVAELPYLVMSLVDGPDLHRWILQHGPLPLVQSLRIAHQIATGLLAAHRQGIVHRDVKPGNILIQPSIMQASLTDFGLAMVADEASLTNSGLTPGTPSYMSPEQARGETIDARSDWYSLGCVLYTMLVGHPPFRGPHAMAILTRLQNEDPKPPSHYRAEIPPWLDRLTMQLLVRDPGLRLTDGPHIARLLSECIQHLEHPAVNSLPVELAIGAHWRGRNPTLVSGVLASILLICLFVWWSVHKRSTNEAGAPIPETATPTQFDSVDSTEVLQAEALLQLMSIEAEELEREHQIWLLDRDISAVEVEVAAMP